MKKKVLYIEDEPFLGKIVHETLEKEGFDTTLVADGAKVMQVFNEFVPDICIIDIMLPNVDGYTLGEMIRKRYPSMPIVFLTAKTETADVIKGFESGGTDYIRKPFSIEELIARIDNQLKLIQPNQSKKPATTAVVHIGQYKYHRHQYELEGPSLEVRLSQREHEVLSILIDNQNKAIERKDILQTIWGDDSYFNSRNLDVYIRKLREHFSNDSSIEIITLKGKGYLFSVK
ncbi:MAG: DNA-binding response regulator [Salinivirgaceae bacterium]|nr:MAG: DNA-binding response regulator [Salinivirgaceae bacterium]